MVSFLQNSFLSELFQFSFGHSQIYTSSHKQKTPRMWGLIAVTNYFSLLHYHTYG